MDTRTFLTEIIPIKDKSLKQILEKECKVDIFRQGSSINEVGKIDNYVRFLINGAVRGYIVDKKDKETTTIFMTHPGDIIAGSRMLDGSPSEIGFKVLKDSEVFSVPAETILRLRVDHPEIIDLQIYMLSQSSIYHWETKKMLYLKTATERYEWFLQHYPELIECVNHADIASFLNITPVTLSRIRHHYKDGAGGYSNWSGVKKTKTK